MTTSGLEVGEGEAEDESAADEALADLVLAAAIALAPDCAALMKLFNGFAVEVASCACVPSNRAPAVNKQHRALNRDEVEDLMTVDCSHKRASVLLQRTRAIKPKQVCSDGQKESDRNHEERRG